MSRRFGAAGRRSAATAHRPVVGRWSDRVVVDDEAVRRRMGLAGGHETGLAPPGPNRVVVPHPDGPPNTLGATGGEPPPPARVGRVAPAMPPRLENGVVGMCLDVRRHAVDG